MCFLGVWKREKTRREAGPRAKLSKIPFFFFIWEVPGAIYSPKRVFRGNSPWRAADGPSRIASLKRTLIWLILTPLERSWLPVYEKIWNLKIQRLEQKLWLSEVCGASIGASSRFSWYLSHSNSNSHWNENLIIFTMALVSTSYGCRIKIRVFRATGDRLRVKLVKNIWEARVWWKTMKNVVL